MSHATDNPQGPIDTKIRISSGRMVDLNAFTSEDVDLFSINRSLNNLRRFTGHYKFSRPLSVAQHTMLVKMIADRLYPRDGGTRLMCIIHDFPEAYYSDLSSPLKRHLGDSFRNKIKEIDRVVFETLWDYWTYDWECADDKQTNYTDYEAGCKQCDHISLRIEQNKMFGTIPPEPYVQEFFEQYDTSSMFYECSKYEIDLVNLYNSR